MLVFDLCTSGAPQSPAVVCCVHGRETSSCVGVGGILVSLNS